MLQQDFAPSHGARATRDWLERNMPDFIRKEEWPSGNPDLNPLDYNIFWELEQMACQKRHPNVESLKCALMKAVAEFLMARI